MSVMRPARKLRPFQLLSSATRPLIFLRLLLNCRKKTADVKFIGLVEAWNLTRPHAGEEGDNFVFFSFFVGNEGNYRLAKLSSSSFPFKNEDVNKGREGIKNEKRF